MSFEFSQSFWTKTALVLNKESCESPSTLFAKVSFDNHHNDNNRASGIKNKHINGVYPYDFCVKIFCQEIRKRTTTKKHLMAVMQRIVAFLCLGDKGLKTQGGLVA